MFVHLGATRRAALDLLAAGLNDHEVARRLSLPRSTVLDWRQPPYRRHTPLEYCHRCWAPTRPVRFEPADYAELLGLYLGDGHISSLARTEQLRISLDARHATVVGETHALLRRSFPGNRHGRVIAEGGSMVVLRVYHNHLSCLFPQHGPGKKHERAIELEPWQSDLVAAEP